MKYGRRPLFLCSLPFVLIFCTTVALWAFHARQEARESRRPAFGIKAAGIRHASAHASEVPSWGLAEKRFADPQAQLRHAKELYRGGRSDVKLYAVAQRELDWVIAAAYPGLEAEEALYLKARSLGLWGEGRGQESLDAYESFLEKFPESDRLDQVYYEMGLTCELGLKNESKARSWYRKAVALNPNELPGLLAARQLDQTK